MIAQLVALVLDLLLAGGLLRLSGAPSWRNLLTAVAVLAVRSLVLYALRRRADAPAVTCAG